MIGALLCGGNSSRMGRDKATASLAGKPMGMWVVEALLAGGLREVVALGATELPLDVIADVQPKAGPLGALIGAIETLGEVFVAPCDVPLLRGDAVRDLIVTANQQPHADAVLARTDRTEPLVGIYRPAALDALRAQRDRPDTRAGPRHALDNLEVVTATTGDLANVNTADDLAAAKRQLAATAGAAR